MPLAEEIRWTIAVVGCGHWGPHHIRVFAGLPGVTVAWAVDQSAERRRQMAFLHPHVRVTSRYEDALEDHRVDAVVVATPAATHASFALAALRAGKHVLCEKPLGVSSAECAALVAEAAARGLVLMVGHVFLFNGGVLKLKDLVDTGELGRLRYASAVRANLGPIRDDVNAAWDLAAHEIAIFNFLFNARPVTASASGRAYSGRRVEDLAFITLEYPGGLMAGIMASWLHPRKVRAISVVGDRRMATFDDLAPSPVAIHGGRAPLEPYYESYGEFALLSRETEVTFPAIPPAEPLKEQARFFISAMDKGTAAVASGERGWDVVLALEAISESMRRGGAPVAAAARPEPPAQP